MKPHRQHQFITILFIVSLIFLPIPFSWAQDEATPEVTQPLPQETPLVEPSPNPADILPTLEPTPLPTETPAVPPTVEPTFPPTEIPISTPSVEPTVEITQIIEPTPETTVLPTVETTPEITVPPVLESPTDDIASLLDALLVFPLIVTNTNDSGEGSLRAAIEYANSNPGEDTITFNIPGDGPHTIQPQTPLPDLTDTVTIDGLSQPGASCAAWPPTLKIEVTSKLIVWGQYTKIQGLVLNRASGIEIYGNNATIACNFIGTDVTGAVALGNQSDGILVAAQYATVGTVYYPSPPDQGNLISGNPGVGIRVIQAGAYTTINGNYIGTNALGSAPLANGADGIYALDAFSLQIGGRSAKLRNLISGNAGNGISIAVNDPTNPANAGSVSIQGNYIGTDTIGTIALGNQQNGVVSAFAPYVEIGGGWGSPIGDNLISGNLGCGVIALRGQGDNSHLVVGGNYIGTDVTGTQPLGNNCGVTSSNGVLITANLISGNNGPGLITSFGSKRGDMIERNIIGADILAQNPLGNGGDGILLQLDTAGANGSSLVEHNTIAYNGGAGISTRNITTPDEVENFIILTNQIFGNSGLGIDLNGDGVTANDPGDADGYGFGLQNFPILDPVMIGSTHITGSLSSLPNSVFEITVFASQSCDPSGYGEGQKEIGANYYLTTDQSGFASFTIDVQLLQGGQFLTAIARSDRGTSEFSPCVEVKSETEPGPLVVTNTNDSGAGSLRAAIEAANSSPGAAIINFNIPGDGPHSIQPLTPLPEITDGVFIDGLSQPGASCNVWPPTLQIELSARLIIRAQNSSVRGLVVNRAGGIELYGKNSAVTCNFIGTDVTGTMALGNHADGIRVGAYYAIIGGGAPGQANLISGNPGAGIRLDDGTDYVRILANYIGTNVSGTAALGNGGDGIYAVNPSNVLIGGRTPEVRNIISGNMGNGIYLDVDPNGNVVENTETATIRGNYIGTDVTGTIALGNGQDGIRRASIRNVFIGSDAVVSTDGRNIISGNGMCGIAARPSAMPAEPSQTMVEENYIGTDVTGTKPLGNSCGVYMWDDIGLTHNLISGNHGPGVIVVIGNPGSEYIIDNIIGMDATETKPLGNQGEGVRLEIHSQGERYSPAWVLGNLIAYNGTEGIRVISNNPNDANLSVGYRLQSNRIFENNGLGIDISDPGVTPNDPGDWDGDQFGWQNFPELRQPVAGSTTITGRLSSLSGESFKIQIFVNESCDPSGYGEGKTSFGETEVRDIPSGGSGVFTLDVWPRQLIEGEYLTATATTIKDGTEISTSEFSPCVKVVREDELVQPIVTNTNDSGEGSLRAAIELSNINPDADTISFNIPGDGPHTIQPETPLPEIIDTVTLDGLSQPGASCDAWPPTLKIEIRSKLRIGADYSQIRGLVFNQGGGLEIIEAYVNVTCNFIGTDVTGTFAMNTDGTGIFLADHSIKIGGTTPTERNLISGNFYGIFALEGPRNPIIQGNYIGTDVTGQAAIGNYAGISLDSVFEVKIGGTEPGAGNLISGNDTGIAIFYDADFTGQTTYAGVIQGNLIGTDATGTHAIPNITGVSASIVPILIGGDEPGARNLISGNSGCGLQSRLYSGNSIAMMIQGNYIGTDISGTKALGNACGVSASNGSDIRDNLISGNNGIGATLSNGMEGYDRLHNNIIGADVTGTKPLGNQDEGVRIHTHAGSNSWVGVDNNLIAYNGGAGVSVIKPDWAGAEAIVDYSIGENRIFANGGLGIDLLNDGVTPNDPGDGDGNLLGLQNFPELNTASVGSTVVNGRLYSNEGDTYRIQVFTNDSCDRSGYGEGQTFIGETTVIVNQHDVGLFSLTVPPLQAGQYLTATASFYGTSEFSRCVRVVAGPPAPILRYPHANGTVSSARPALSWYPVPNARRYHLQLSSNVDFSAIIADMLVASTAAAPATLLPGIYYWRVQAETTTGVWSPYSEVRSFSYVIMKAPLPGRQIFSHYPQFSWYAYPRALRYQLQVDNNTDFASPEAQCIYTHRVLNSPSCAIPGGLPYDSYYWRVNIDLGNGFIVSPIAWPVMLMARP